VNLKVWGDSWSAPLYGLTAGVLLPKHAAMNTDVLVWGHPPWVKGKVTRSAVGTTLEAQQVIPPHQWVEMRTVFPRTLLASPGGAKVVSGLGQAKIIAEENGNRAAYISDKKKLDDAKNNIGRTLLFLALLGLAPALGIIVLVWLIYGRERKADYDREYEQA